MKKLKLSKDVVLDLSMQEMGNIRGGAVNTRVPDCSPLSYAGHYGPACKPAETYRIEQTCPSSLIDCPTPTPDRGDWFN